VTGAHTVRYEELLRTGLKWPIIDKKLCLLYRDKRVQIKQVTKLMIIIFAVKSSIDNTTMSYNGYNDANSYRSPVIAGWPAAPSNQLNDEQSMAYYGRPSYHQPETESSSRLAFLYDRAYNAPPQQNVTNQHHSSNYQPYSPEGAVHNGFTTVNGNDENELPPQLPTVPPPSVEYQSMSRAMPAPMYQHGARVTEAPSDKSPAIRQTAAPAPSGPQSALLSPAAQVCKECLY
jgi:hypothetical protein